MRVLDGGCWIAGFELRVALSSRSADEGCLDDARLDGFAPHPNFQGAAEIGIFGRNVAEADGFSEARGGCARRDAADFLIGQNDGVPGTGDAAPLDFEAHQLLAPSLSFTFFDGFVADKAPLLALDEAAEPRFQG